MASRYSSYISSNTSSFDSRSSTKSDPASSTEHLHHSSRALVKSNKKTTSINPTKNNHSNLSSMMKKLVETKAHGGSSKSRAAHEAKLYIPSDFIAEDLKKNGVKKVGGFGAIQKKLFKGLKGKKEGEGGNEGRERKALMEVKNSNGNTRTLAMVLRSERELLSANKEQEEQINEFKLLLEEKNIEVEKLKDLCLKQREEIKSLKNSILFPDVMNSHLEELLEKQGSELKQAKQLIPSLQRQVTSLTGQLQCLAEDLAEVKADKIYSANFYESNARSPIHQGYYEEEAANSLEFSSGDHTTPGSPDDLFLKDLNPCLTPFNVKAKSSKEFNDSPDCDEWSHKQMGDETDLSSCSREVSKSSGHSHCSKAMNNSSSRLTRRSDESRCTSRKQMHQKLF